MKRGRTGIVVCLIASMLCTAAMRQWALNVRQEVLRTPDRLDSTDQNSLASMDSYALALMLGGLRGPLVMALWTSSEAQKTQHDLEDFDTKVEWIRLLQPEFDSVHVFEIWNKAYNISVMRASVSSKYSDILDALNYARKVDAVHPHDINILYEIGHLYFDKLGKSAEQAYYRHRVQTESLQQMLITFPAGQAGHFRDAMKELGADPDMVRLDVDSATNIATAITCKPYADVLKDVVSGATCRPAPLTPVQQSGDPGWRPTEQQRIADFNGQVLPDFLKPGLKAPFHGPGGDYDGADLQFLADYAPYPYGVSVFAIAYNYNKRCRLLMELGQKQLYTSNYILDGQTSMSLLEWSQDEQSQARLAEMRMDHVSAPQLGNDEKVLAARDVDWKTPVTAIIARDQATHCYAMALKLCTDSMIDYERNIHMYEQSYNNFNNHVYELRDEQAMCRADLDYLLAGTADAEHRQALLDESRDSYNLAIELNGLTILRFYADDWPLLQALTEAEKEFADVPAGTTNQTVDLIPLPRIPAVMALLRKYNTEYFKNVYDQHGSERMEREADIERAGARLQYLTPPTTLPG